MSFYGRLRGAVFKYYLNAMNIEDADWQSAEYEEAKATTDGSEEPCLNDIQTE